MRDYSKIKTGWRSIGETPRFYRSKWEANYARYLQFLKVMKHIKGWRHEPKTFWFEAIKRGIRSYLPDFEVTNNDGSVEYHEVKGYMDSRSRTKIKRMTKYYPHIKLVVVRGKQYAEIKAKVSPIIFGWEE